MIAMRFLLAMPVDCPPASPLRIADGPGACFGMEPGLWFADSGRQTRLGQHGAVLGSVFTRSGCIPLTSRETATWRSGRPADLAVALTRECWGAYLALLSDPANGRLWLFPDPSGLLPVYTRRTETHCLFASEAELLYPHKAEQPTVAWGRLDAFLRRPELRQSTTCLEGVNELVPGRLIPAHDPVAQGTQLWQPEFFLPGNRSLDNREAAATLRELGIATIGAWAMQFGRVAVAASGGVDSSFICAALAGGGHDFDCISLATRDPSGDESAYVRPLAERFGARLVVARYDPSLVDFKVPASYGLARPCRRSFQPALDHALQTAARHFGAATVFDGNGGDNLFCYLHSAAPVVDRLRLEGPGRGALATGLDMCRVTGCDLPIMLRAVLRRLIRGGVRTWPADDRLLVARRGGVDEALTDWSKAEVGAHLGKRDHLQLIQRGQNQIHPTTCPTWPRFSPLASQPLVEYCLSLPTWLWCEGGLNRAPARAAFAAELPPSIVRRTSKAGPDSFIRQLFDINRTTIRGLLLDGLLRSNALLDLPATEAALKLDAFTGTSLVYRLLDLVEAETWARSWSR